MTVIDSSLCQFRATFLLQICHKINRNTLLFGSILLKILLFDMFVSVGIMQLIYTKGKLNFDSYCIRILHCLSKSKYKSNKDIKMYIKVNMVKTIFAQSCKQDKELKLPHC